MRSIVNKKKKQKENTEKAFYVEALNEHKAEIVSALKNIFDSYQWRVRCEVKWKLIKCLAYFHDEDKLNRITNLRLKYSQLLANIGWLVVPGIVFIDRVVNQKLKNSTFLLYQLKFSLEGFIDESLIISIEQGRTNYDYFWSLQLTYFHV